MSSETPIALIVDDDADIRLLLDRVLTQSGFRTVMTANAIDGVAAVEEFSPTVTMLDVSMPGMDGFAAARKIREFSDTHIIMLTALSDEIDVIQGLGAGANDYLLKPFRPRELRARVETILRRPRTRPDAPPQTAADEAEPTPATSVWTASQARSSNPIAHPGAAPASPVPSQSSPVPSQSSPVPSAPSAAQPVAQPLPHAGPPPPPPPELRHRRTGGDWIEYHGLAVEPVTSAVTVEGRNVTLNPSEFALLATLMESRRRVRSTANLVLTLRGESYVTTYYVNEADKNAVTEHMINLRRKLGDTAVTPRWIENVPGVGYRLAQD